MLDLENLQNEVKSHCEALGVFDYVVTSDPNTALESGLIASVMLSLVEPDRTSSGLAVSSARVDFVVRIFRNQTIRPNFDIDIDVMKAAEAVINSLHTDVTFNGQITALKFFTGENFGAKSGYVVLPEGVLRVVDVTMPLQVADVWDQERTDL